MDVERLVCHGPQRAVVYREYCGNVRTVLAGMIAWPFRQERPCHAVEYFLGVTVPMRTDETFGERLELADVAGITSERSDDVIAEPMRLYLVLVRNVYSR